MFTMKNITTATIQKLQGFELLTLAILFPNLKPRIDLELDRRAKPLSAAA
jgi:hypothetical protein